MDLLRARAARKKRRKGCIAQIEPARISAERRQNAAPPVADETAPPHRTGRADDARDGMKMAGDFMIFVIWIGGMAKFYPADHDFATAVAAEIGRKLRIMIAGKPNPFAPAL